MGGVFRRRQRDNAARAIPAAEPVPEIGPEHLADGLLNVVVFGPGRGEAIVVMLPDGSVGIVDGCREPKYDDGRNDPVRELLARLDGAGRLPRLRFVCLTHPHGDHYAGLGRLLAAYRGRVEEIWYAFETGSRYAEAYLDYLKKRQAKGNLPDRDDPKGLERVLTAMRHRETRPVPRSRTVQEHTWMMEERMKAARLRIRGVAPVTRDLQLAQDALITSIQALQAGNPTREFDPNHASGALLVEWGTARVLLAGDLTNGGEDEHRGWNLAREQITGPVQVVNVAHHGSEGAHHHELWQLMRPTLAIVTPYQDGQGSHPPRPKDIERLATNGTHVVITAIPQWDWEHDRSSLPRPMRATVPASIYAVTKSPAMKQSLSSDRRVAAKRNAVAVALDRTGGIRRLVLAGDADLYQSSGPGP